jgi:glyoxylase-like metal-dependent hydrolase (beta-lactamase superfamily II)
VYFRQLLNDDTACASYLFGCKSKRKLAVVDPHDDAHLVTDLTRSTHPWLVLTGEETVEQMASRLYQSVTERLLTLPDHLLLYPAHYSGSVCGRGLSAQPASTIGFERRHNKAVQFKPEQAFVEASQR